MNNLHMDLERVLADYESALNKIEDINQSITESEVIALLMARDRLKKIVAEYAENTPNVFLKIHQLDERLCNCSSLISKSLDLKRYRKSFHISEESWWWYFSKYRTSRNRFDWLWNSLTIACLTANLSLFLDITSRFLTGGTDLFGSFAIIFQSLLTLLAAGGTLSKTGRKAVDSLLEYKGISKHHRHRAKLALAIGALAILFTIHVNLPQIAKIYNYWGKESQIKHEWSSARNSFEKALNFDSDNPESYFRLGLLYEDLPDLKQAKIQYQLSVQGEQPEAFNNLARLYILEGEYSEALVLLNRLENLLDDEYTNALEYAIRKNRGWAKLEQNNLNEAEAQLKEAILIDPSKGAAHCLIAQIYEKQDRESAFESWEKCLANIPGSLPEEEVWIQKAKEYFNESLSND